MRRRLLWAVFAMLFVLTLHCIALAADEASKTAKKFDQKAELERLWAAPDNTVVGSVNGIKVTKGELLKMMWFTAAPNMLQDLLNQKMIQEAARKANVKLEWSEVQEAINKSLQRMNAESVDQLLNQYKITWYRFMSGIKLSTLAEKLVAKQMKITDAQYAEWVKARHILVRFPQDEQDRAKAEADAKAKIDAILARVKAGEDFAKVADEVSEDPGNIRDGKKQGGDLGWFTRGRMVQEFENAAFQMKAGEISEPVKTFYGYHIIKLEKLGKDATEAEKAELRKMIIERDMPMKIGQWFSEPSK